MQSGVQCLTILLETLTIKVMASLQTLQAMILGIVQGLTEFLPVSSSAHLLLIPWMLGWEPMGLTFDVILHGGTLIALVIYFRHEWLQIIRQIFVSTKESRDYSLATPLMIGTFPAAIFGLFFDDLIEHQLRSPEIVVFTLFFFGLMLWAADKRGSQKRGLQGLTGIDGLIIGLAQAMALVPGVSRSGITITAALFLGISRADSARFSFLLGTPIIAGATVLKLYDLLQTQDMIMASSAPLVAGVLFSSISGFLCIKYFLSFLRARTYLAFVIYRLVLAVFILLLLVL